MSKLTKQCLSCENFFEAKRVDAKYCSAACKQYEYRYRIYNHNWNIELQRIQELSDKKNKLAEQYKQETLKAQTKANQEQSNKMIAEFKEKNDKMVEDFKLQLKLDNANYTLKNWLKALSKIDDSKIFDTFTDEYLLKEIIAYKQTAVNKLPENYKYSDFIFNMLIPAIESFLNKLNNESENLPTALLSSDMKMKILDILREIEA